MSYAHNTVFRTFLQHALTYWAEILYMFFFIWITDEVRVSSIHINFCMNSVPFWNLEYWKYTVFCAFYSVRLSLNFKYDFVL